MCNSRARVNAAQNPVAPLGATAGAVSSEGEIMARTTKRPEQLTGPHHFTGITADVVTNVDFWCRVLGLRFVKNTLNFATTFRHHTYFGDEEGHPGSVVPFLEFTEAPP